MVKLRCKVVLLGDSTVGKTCIVKQFMERTFPQQYLMTNGVNLQVKVIRVPMDEFITDEEREQWQMKREMERQQNRTTAELGVSVESLGFGMDLTTAGAMGNETTVNRTGNNDSREHLVDPEMLKHEVELFIYDIGTQSIYETEIKDYLANATAFILAYDVANLESFRNLSKYYEMVKQTKAAISEKASSLSKLGSEEPKSSNSWEFPIGVLLANKVDNANMTKVNLNQGQMFAQRNKLEFFQSSAAQDEGIDMPFQFIADRMYRMYKRRLSEMKSLAGTL